MKPPNNDEATMQCKSNVSYVSMFTDRNRPGTRRRWQEKLHMDLKVSVVSGREQRSSKSQVTEKYAYDH